ncbi:MAG: hypothetical protein ACREAK_03960 [Nitrosarchaeum sp.]
MVELQNDTTRYYDDYKTRTTTNELIVIVVNALIMRFSNEL